MDELHRQSSWSVLGASVQGPYHKNKGQPNEDAIGWFQKKPGNLPIILSVADGVGDETCFRSDRGAQFAVEASIEISRKYLRKIPRWGIRQIRLRLMGEIVRQWNRKIAEDIRNNPFSPNEEIICSKHNQFIASRMEGGKISRSEMVQSYPYSTTLNIVIITRDILVALQVGDGDIVIEHDDGSTSEIFPRELDCGSVIPLSDPNIIEYFNIYRKKINQIRPMILYISTDGYSAGYDTFSKGCPTFDEVVAFEFHSKIQEYSASEIQQALPDLLDVLSQGSSDDLTLGIVVGPLDKIKKTPLRLKKLNPQIQLENIMDDTESQKGSPLSAPSAEKDAAATDDDSLSNVTTD